MPADEPAPAGAPPDDAGCHVLHVDMDAFYASVEVRDRPDLAGRPVVIGGLGPRSVVLSATYEARAFGVRSAMPVGRARRLCPQAVFIPPRHSLYGEVSKEVMAVFRAVTPAVEPLSLDEAFLDVSGALRRLGTPTRIARLIRAQVREQQGITCSVGVAPVKFVAKIASARCKPDGLLVVPAAGLLDFLHPLPASALWGVGERAEQVLARLGLRTVGDIAHVPLATLQRELGAVGEHLWSLAWGRDERLVVPHREEKSVGAEETFAADVDDPEVIRRELLRLSGRTAQALRAAGCVARTISVKLRLDNFKTITRSRTLTEPTDVAREIYTTACALYEGSGLGGGARLRLVGVRAAGLRPAAGTARQLAFGDRPAGWREAERAVDQIARRFGSDAVRPAALVSADRQPSSRPSDSDGETPSSKARGEPRILGNEPRLVSEVKVTPPPGSMGGVVPLSEHEQRQLEQIEQALYREDRRLGRLVRSSDPRVHYKRRVVQAASCFAIGAGMVAAGVVLPLVWLAVGGFVVMLLCGIMALNNWRHMAGAVLGLAGRGSAAKRGAGRKKHGKKSRGAMMERLDERWRRRQEGDL